MLLGEVTIQQLIVFYVEQTVMLSEPLDLNEHTKHRGGVEEGGTKMVQEMLNANNWQSKKAVETEEHKVCKLNKRE